MKFASMYLGSVKVDVIKIAERTRPQKALRRDAIAASLAGLSLPNPMRRAGYPIRREVFALAFKPSANRSAAAY